MAKRKVNVKGTEMVAFSKEKEAYISLTDIAKYKDSERTNYIVQNWMRSRSTIEFIGLWELLHNPDFKGIEFDAFKLNKIAIDQMKVLIANRSIKKLKE